MLLGVPPLCGHAAGTLFVAHKQTLTRSVSAAHIGPKVSSESEAHPQGLVGASSIEDPRTAQAIA